MNSDRIDYTEPFKKNVKGHLKAKFKLDTNGKPLYRESGGLRHYIIDLFLETEQSKEIKGVHYYMNDTSYVNPHGYSENPDTKFTEEISSYGDVEVLVTVEMAKQKYEQQAWLSNMLESGHAADMDMTTPEARAIQAALKRIRLN